jgi:hypothetical protein
MAVKPKEAFKKDTKEETKDKEKELSYQLQLGVDDKKAIVDKVVDMLEEAEASRAGWLAIRKASIDQYEGIKQNTDLPWNGHSNISTMVTTVACDLLHAKLFPMVWNEQSITWEGMEEHDLETSNVNKIVMSWVASVDMRLMDKIDDIIQLLVVDGTVAIKLLWKVYYKYVTRKIPKITYNSFVTGKFEYDVKVDYIRDERCELDIRPIEKVYIPYHSDSTNPRWEDDAEYILDERWYTLDDLKEMKAKGQLTDNVSLDDLSLAINALPEFSGTEQARMSAEGSAPPPPRKDSYKLRCIEGYIKHAIVKGDDVRKQCVFLIAVEPKFYLSGRALHHVSRIGRRPWIIRPFLRRPGRAYGKGVPELVRHLHTLLDAIFNQGIDAGNRVIGGGGFYRPASGTNPRRLQAGPATWVPVDDPKNDIYIPTYNLSGLQWSSNEMRLVLELIERLTYLTPAMLGKESASRPTARGTLAVIQQGESKFTLIGGRAQQIICDLLTDIRQKYEENMPPAKWERILGKSRLNEYPSPEYMIGNYEAKMQLDLTSIDLEGKRSLAMGMYQMMAFDPLVTQNPAFMWQVRADLLEAFRRTPVEKYIGPMPPSPTPEDAETIFSMIEQEKGGQVQALMAKIDPTAVMPRLMELRKTERYERFTPEARIIFNDVIRKLQMAYIEGVERRSQIYGQGVSPFAGFEELNGANQPFGPRSVGPQAPRTVGPGQNIQARAGSPQG